MATAIGGPNMVGAGTVSAETTYGGSYAPQRAADGNYGTNWFGSGGYRWWMVDFGDTPREINEVRIAPAVEDQSPRGFLVQSSNDLATWTDEWAGFSIANWNGNTLYYFPRPDIGDEARYWMLWMNGTDLDSSDMLVCEFELATAPDGPNIATPNYLGFADLSAAFDGNPASYSYSANGHQVIGNDLGAPVAVAEARLLTTGDTSGTNFRRIPGTGVWYKSNDKYSWQKIADYNSRNWNPAEKRAFPLGAGSGGGGRRRQAIIVT